MDKARIKEQIMAALTLELEKARGAARDSCAAATDPDSKAENKYDTRTLEASYLARGQAVRVAELTEAIADWALFNPGPGIPGGPVKTGDLVTVREAEEGRVHYFIGPACGGLEVAYQQETIIVITPSSPLGKKLMGARPGAMLELIPGRLRTRLEVVAIC